MTGDHHAAATAVGEQIAVDGYSVVEVVATTTTRTLMMMVALL